MHTQNLYIKTFKIAPTCFDHLQGATLFLAKVTLKKITLINFRILNLVLCLTRHNATQHTTHARSQAHSQHRTACTIRHAATAPS